MKMLQTVGRKLSHAQAAVFLMFMSLVPGLAFAQAQAPDTTSILDEFSTYKVAVIGLVIAFAVVLWAIRAANLLKPR